MSLVVLTVLSALTPGAAQDPGPAAGTRAAPADLIVEGRVFTGVAESPWAEALAVRQNRIVAVGTRAEIAALRGAETRVIRAPGRSVLPGFNDAHAHFTVAYGIDLGCDLSPATSWQEIRDLLRRYAAQHADAKVLAGAGWDLADFDGRYPTAAMLDEVVADRPVVLSSEGPHALWVNTAAMREASMVDNADPDLVHVVRDGATGEPSGVFLGRGLLGLAPRGGFPAMDEVRAGIERGLREARALGVTTVQESVSPFLLPILVDLHHKGELTLRFHVWGTLTGPFGGARATDRAARLYRRDGFITFGTLKGGVDGMPGLRTAALLEPYADDASTRGLSFWDEDLTAAVLDANARGYQVALHATGDGGVRAALDALAGGHRAHGTRNRIEHAFLIAPDDLPRFARHDVVASVQPGFLSVDLAKNRYYERRFGPKRCENAHPLRALRDAGAVLAFGTDFNLTPLDPMVGLHAAVARTMLDGTPEGGWTPAQKITLEQAVRAYTWGSAYAEGAETDKGTLAAGKLADIVVLSQDIFATDARDLLGVKVTTTIVDGDVVFER